MYRAISRSHLHHFGLHNGLWLHVHLWRIGHRSAHSHSFPARWNWRRWHVRNVQRRRSDRLEALRFYSNPQSPRSRRSRHHHHLADQRLGFRVWSIEQSGSLEVFLPFRKYVHCLPLSPRHDNLPQCRGLGHRACCQEMYWMLQRVRMLLQRDKHIVLLWSMHNS